MKRLGVVSTAVLFLLLGNPAAVWAGPRQQDEAKSRPQEEPKPEKREEKRSQQEQPKQEETKKAQDQKQAQHQAQPGSKAAVAGKHGARIPQDKFQAHFGRSHTFVVNQPVIVEGQPRFQVAGFWFEIIDPWPVGWLYTDACYIDFIGDTYYLFDPLHPGIQVAILVVE